MTTSKERAIIRTESLLECRPTVGPLTLDQVIGVRIPALQPTRRLTSKNPPYQVVFLCPFPFDREELFTSGFIMRSKIDAGTFKLINVLQPRLT